MKRNILAVILVICACFGAYGQNTTPIDLILLLNTSSDMSSSYENVNNYTTGGFLSEFLRTGDTFHLITFSANPRLDAARRISSLGDVETIIGRILLQYPVESGNNLAAAIAYAEQYITSLPARPKKIVIVSTGGSDTNNLVNTARQRLNSVNTTLDFVQVTRGQALTDLPRSGRPAEAAITTTTATATTAAAAPAATTATATTAAAAPAATTATATTAAAAPAATTATTTTVAAAPAATTTPTTTSTTSTTTAATQRPQVSPPEETVTASRTGSVQETVTPQGGTAAGAADTSAAATTEESNQASADRVGRSPDPAEPQDSADPAGTSENAVRETTAAAPERLTETSVESLALSAPLVIVIILLLLLLLGLVILFASRRLGSGPNRAVAEAASAGKRDDSPPLADHSKDLAKYAAVQTRQRTTPYSNRPAKPESAKPVTINPSGPLLINLLVEDQNTAIGKRNIHSLKSGYSLTVGGGKSDFLIFLVPIPPNIGEVHRNGSQLSFIPRKPKYFPDLGSGELRNCLNKTIRIISDKNYELRFRFEMYEDPLIALNRMLMSIKVPG